MLAEKLIGVGLSRIDDEWSWSVERRQPGGTWGTAAETLASGCEYGT